MLKIYIDPSSWTSRVSSKNKEKKAKRENSVKKDTKQKKKRYKETEKIQRRQEWNPVYLHVQATP